MIIHKNYSYLFYIYMAEYIYIDLHTSGLANNRMIPDPKQHRYQVYGIYIINISIYGPGQQPHPSSTMGWVGVIDIGYYQATWWAVLSGYLT